VGGTVSREKKGSEGNFLRGRDEITRGVSQVPDKDEKTNRDPAERGKGKDREDNGQEECRPGGERKGVQ